MENRESSVKNQVSILDLILDSHKDRVSSVNLHLSSTVHVVEQNQTKVPAKIFVLEITLYKCLTHSRIQQVKQVHPLTRFYCP